MDLLHLDDIMRYITSQNNDIRHNLAKLHSDNIVAEHRKVIFSMNAMKQPDNLGSISPRLWL